MSYVPLLPEATNFDDMVKREQAFAFSFPHECPLCKGFGGWNLNLPKEPGGRRDRASCRQCNGMGYVGERDLKCIHLMKRVGQFKVGATLHSMRCINCGKEEIQDSGD